MDKEVFTVPMPSEKELLGKGPSFHKNIYSMLRTANVFDDFERSELMFIAKHMRAYRMSAGETVYHEGDRSGYFSVLIEGRIAVYKQDSDDNIKFLNNIHPGKIFGEISLIDDGPSSASIIAETDVVIVEMDRESFRQCISEDPVAGVHLLNLVARMLCVRLRSASSRLVDYIDVWG